jgi:ribonucleoside-diphosphate reductase alpha chain
MTREHFGRPQDVTATQPISHDVLKEKYLKPGESGIEDIYRRVARALASVEPEAERAKHEALFLENLHAGAIGAGRIMSAAGTSIQATLINCFVQPVGDCIQGFDDGGYPGIYEALREAAETMRRGGGVGYDFSRIRPRVPRRATASIASGPQLHRRVRPFLRHRGKAGARRGAQMGVLRIDHPDVLEFITAKRKPGRWSNFNVSVAVTQAFMEALDAGDTWSLVHRARPGAALLEKGAHQREDGKWVYRTLPAAELWDTVMRSAYDFAEPGILFPDTINRDNNLRYCEDIRQQIPAASSPATLWLLRSRPGDPDALRTPAFGFGGTPEFDFESFAASVALQVRALDNVLDLTFWPLPQQRAEAMAKRRIGVGFTGMGDALSMLCLRYDEAAGREMAVRIARCMRDAAYAASVELAREKGAFPAFDAARYMEAGTFASRLDEPLKQQIRKHGIRNSHLLSIAPTGTVSLAFADNASNGIEPAFSGLTAAANARATARSPNTTSKTMPGACTVRSGDITKLPPYFVSAMEMPASAHVAMMQAVQPFVDTAISKTVNGGGLSVRGIQEPRHEAWKAGSRAWRPTGLTVSWARLQADVPKPSPEEATVSIDLMRTVIASRPKGALPAMAEKIEYWTQQGRQHLYLVVSFLPLPDGRQRAIEFFMPVGQSGESQQWVTASMRLLSLAARGGFLDRALADMRKVAWDRGPVRLGTYRKADGTHVPLWHDSEVAAIAYALQNLIAGRNGHATGAPLRRANIAAAPAPMSGSKCP